MMDMFPDSPQANRSLKGAENVGGRPILDAVYLSCASEAFPLG